MQRAAVKQGKAISALVVVFVISLLQLRSFAQVPSIVEGSTFESRPGQWRRVIRNQSTSPLVAFRVPCRGPVGGLITLQDALLYAGNEYVGPGAHIEVPAGDPTRCSGSVEAAIFSDGHIEGDRDVVDRELFSTRRGAYKALEYSIKLLGSVPTDHTPIEHIVDTLVAKRQSSVQERTEAGTGYTFILDLVLGALRNSHVVYQLPSDKYGQKQPQPSIEDLMNTNGLSREEARVLLFSKRLEQWKSLLENNLQPRQ